MILHDVKLILSKCNFDKQTGMSMSVSVEGNVIKLENSMFQLSETLKDFAGVDVNYNAVCFNECALKNVTKTSIIKNISRSEDLTISINIDNGKEMFVIKLSSNDIQSITHTPIPEHEVVVDWMPNNKVTSILNTNKDNALMLIRGINHCRPVILDMLNLQGIWNYDNQNEQLYSNGAYKLYTNFGVPNTGVPTLYAGICEYVRSALGKDVYIHKFLYASNKEGYDYKNYLQQGVELSNGYRVFMPTASYTRVLAFQNNAKITKTTVMNTEPDFTINQALLMMIPKFIETYKKQFKHECVVTLTVRQNLIDIGAVTSNNETPAQLMSFQLNRTIELDKPIQLDSDYFLDVLSLVDNDQDLNVSICKDKYKNDVVVFKQDKFTSALMPKIN